MLSSAENEVSPHLSSRTTETQWRHKSKISENLGRCGRQNMLWPYLKIWYWDLIFGQAVKAISSPGVRSPWTILYKGYEFAQKSTIKSQFSATFSISSNPWKLFSSIFMNIRHLLYTFKRSGHEKFEIWKHNLPRNS